MTGRLALCLLCLIGSSAEAGAWSNLWLTPDQQAQRALDAGDAKRAAQLFSDPRRRAYAEAQAKQFDAAAKQLAPFDDAESQYNRGNALAHGGDLQAALGAYDAALKHAPANSPLRHDAQHNRDLVAQQQKQNQQQKGAQQNSKQQRQPQQPPSQANNSQGNSAKDNSGNDNSGKDNANEDNAGKDTASQDTARQNSAHKSGKDDVSKDNTSKDNASAGQDDASKASAGKVSPNPGQAGDQSAAQSSAGPAKDAEQAQRDAATALQHAPNKVDGQGARAPSASAPVKPPTEQALALDQWLRQIPDDPGGLLRRKFLIEHMLKQRGEQP